MSQLTAHFSLDELTRSNKARQLGLDNTPPEDALARLCDTAAMLEEIRDHLSALKGRPVPITVTSAYRSPAVNAAIGSVSTSDHIRGCAADIVAPAFGTPFEVASALAPQVSTLGIGQLILEGVAGKEWVHVSTSPPMKSINRVITVTDAGTFAGIKGAGFA